MIMGRGEDFLFVVFPEFCCSQGFSGVVVAMFQSLENTFIIASGKFDNENNRLRHLGGST